MKTKKGMAIGLAAFIGAASVIHGFPTVVFAQENLDSKVVGNVIENDKQPSIKKENTLSKLDTGNGNHKQAITVGSSVSKLKANNAREVFVDSQRGSDNTGDGTDNHPVQTLAKAYTEVPAQGTIILKSDILLSDCIRIEKDITIRSEGAHTYKIMRNNGFHSISDNNRSWYNPAMVEIAGKGNINVKIENVVLDDANKSEGTEFREQAFKSSGEDTSKNLQVVHDAIVAIYNNSANVSLVNVDLLNFAGMTALKHQAGTLDYVSGTITGGANQTSSKALYLVSPIKTIIGKDVVVKNISGGTAVHTEQPVTFNGKILNTSTEHALTLLNKANVTLSSTSRISNNISSYAGVVYARGQGVTLTVDGEISDNKTLKDNSGAIYAYDTNLILEDNAKIMNNESANPAVLSPQEKLEGKTAGAGIYASENANVIMNGGIISGNRSIGKQTALGDISGYNGGGGIAIVRNSTFIMNGGKIVNNHSNSYGGGIMFHADRKNYSKGKIVLNNGEISGNTAPGTATGNDVYISNFGLNQYYATEAGNYITVSDKVVIGEGIANGKTQFYAKEPISFGNIKKSADKVLRDFAADQGYDPVASLWINSEEVRAKVAFGMKAPEYDKKLNDLYVAFVPIDKVTGEPVNNEVTVQRQSSVENDIVNISLDSIQKLNGKTYGVLLMKGPHINHEPVINAEDKVLNVGDIFHPLDAVTAYDDEDGDITLTEVNILANNVDTMVAGTYHVTYKVTDSNGASVEKTITVTVKAKETNKPEIQEMPQEPSKPNHTTSSKPSEQSKTPQTGDVVNIGILGTMLAGSSGMLALMLKKKCKKK